MKCPRFNCPNEATIHSVYGVIPCDSCRAKDSQASVIARNPEFAVQSKADRVQEQRDLHSGDIEQPFIGDKPNPQFAKIYPEHAREYYSDEQLKNME